MRLFRHPHPHHPSIDTDGLLRMKGEYESIRLAQYLFLCSVIYTYICCFILFILFWTLQYLPFYDLRIIVTPLVP